MPAMHPSVVGAWRKAGGVLLQSKPFDKYKSFWASPFFKKVTFFEAF
ncbi:hypothetical protein K2X14_06015 [Acetobacter sp. TBRC 12305]|nr:hypothetical protein [Acetobacter garciniae]MBX0344396.1 hypothetical protein [Acetobacter garciniae]